MAFSVSSLTSGWAVEESASFSTASVTPSGGSLLVLWVYSEGWGVDSVSGLGANWVPVGRESTQDLNAWAAIVPPDGASGSVDVTTGLVGTNPDVAFCWDLDEVTGARLWCSFVASNIQTATGTSSPASLTFNTAASSDNLFLFGLVNAYTQSAAESPAWTILANVEQQYESYLATQVSPDVSNLTASANLGRTFTWGALGLELAAA